MSTYRRPNISEDPSQYENCPMFLKRYLHFLVFRGKRPNTILEAYMILKEFCQYVHFTNRFHNKPHTKDAHKGLDISCMDIQEIAAFSKRNLEEYLFFLSNEVSNSDSTVAKKLTFLRNLYAYLLRDAEALGIADVLVEDPTRFINRPAVAPATPRILSEQQIEKLIHATTQASVLSATDPNAEPVWMLAYRDKAIILLMCNTALPIAKVAALNRNDIRGNEVLIRNGDRIKQTLYMSKPCQKALEEYLYEVDCQFGKESAPTALFIGKDRPVRLTTRAIQLRISKIAEVAGLKDLNINAKDLRDTATAKLLQASPETEHAAIMKQLGYSSNQEKRFRGIGQPTKANTSDVVKSLVESTFSQLGDN